MTLGIRGNLLVLCLVLLVMIGGAFASFLDSAVAENLAAQASKDLQRRAELAALALEPIAPQDVPALAAELAARSGARLVVRDAAGELIAEAGEAPRDGELRSAKARIARGQLWGEVELISSDREIERALIQLHWLLFGAGLAGLAAAIVLSTLGAQLLTGALRGLVSRAQAASGAKGRRRLSVVGAEVSDELRGLAGSFNRMAEELEASVKVVALERDRIEAVLEGLSEAVIATDPEGRITLVNRSAIDLLGLGGSPAGRPVADASRLGELVQLLASAKPGASASREIDLPGSPPRRLLARAALQRSQAGAVIVVHDVTELRRLELVRRDFVANVSHELRTPMSVIRANAETLLDGALGQPHRARQFVEAILRHADRLTLLIADLLDLSRIEAGRYPIEVKDVVLDEALSRALELVHRPAAEKSLSLSMRVEPAGLAARADPLALEQVLGNLLENAVKYTPAGGKIELVARSIAEGVRIEVRDDGQGVEPGHRERIFERFYRADAGRSRDVGGTGLGLSIVKHLVESMDGDAGVEPNEPRGSVFWVVLPASLSAPATTSAVEPEIRS